MVYLQVFSKASQISKNFSNVFIIQYIVYKWTGTVQTLVAQGSIHLISLLSLPFSLSHSLPKSSINKFPAALQTECGSGLFLITRKYR